MATTRWRVLVAKLGAGGADFEGEVDAANWMGALRKAREAMSESSAIPPGVSCSIDDAGVATVLDAAARRKYVLSPLGEGSASQGTSARPVHPAQPLAPAAVASGEAKAAEPASPSPGQSDEADAAPPAPGKRKRFQTVAFTDGMPAGGPGTAVAVGTDTPNGASAGAPATSAAEQAIAPPIPAPAVATAMEDLELVYTRDVEPTPDNPLCYRERAYLVQRGVPIGEAEAGLRARLATLREELSDRPRGKLVNLAAFDHRWRDTPERPPVVALQWRDWRGDVVVDYPASVRLSSLPPPPGPTAHDERLADVFDALEGLARQQNAADALTFGVDLLERMVPSEAISACLYDINTDELRFVAVLGAGASHVQGKAVPRAAGLFAQALRAENQATLIRDVLVEPAFNPTVDSRPGLDAHQVLLRPMNHERQLVGVLQLVNRKHTGSFDAADVNIVSYVADRLAEFVLSSRRSRSQPAPRR